jgi:phenylalanyl-tRNA synthetase beta chain
MKLSLSWLGDWVDLPPDWDAAELSRRLTLAGFEIEGHSPAAPAFERVIVARITSVEPHPQAEKLRVCRVETGAGAGADAGSMVQIVCGAANARTGLVSALAQIGAKLPGEVTIRAATLRGVQSQGMLCSARELGLAESSEGIIELPADAPVGSDLRQYLDLDDVVLEVNVTANRGDAMSVLGLAREVAALAGVPLKSPLQTTASARGSEAHYPGISIQPGAGAGRLMITVLRGADNTRPTPQWMRERLRRIGVRSISPIVDVTNYVMFELGQPMHAFDVGKVHNALEARRALAGERLTLLDGREIELTDDVLVIADEQHPLGLAGVMGGQSSAIQRETRDIALEVAWFAPKAIAGRARRYGLVTDASQRFERGVDWRGQERAMARAVSLLTQLTGAIASAPRLAERTEELPRAASVTLRATHVTRLLGISVAPAEIERRLASLDMQLSRDTAAVWQVQAPSWRFDIAIEADLIEEIARLGGLDAIREQDAQLAVVPRAAKGRRIDERVVMRTLVARGYHEVITYAFIDPQLQRTLLGDQSVIELVNPIASDLAVMRASLWPGLVRAARENLRRQQSRVRIFEIATQFERVTRASGAAPAEVDYRERKMLAGLVLGTRLPEQWGSATAAVDFYDIKADVEAILGLALPAGELRFEPAREVLCLHPGRSAYVVREGQRIGVLGELHPGLLKTLELSQAPLLFELDYEGAFASQIAQFHENSRFPRIRRDISLTVPVETAFAAVRERVSVAAARLLKELLVFDVYQGDGVETGRKSLALGLILQDLDRTLTDEDADGTVRAVLEDLRAHLDARIREQRQP